MENKNLENKKIIIGISGGIAIYKVCSLIRLLIKDKAQVKVVMTENATKLISPVVFQSLAQSSVYTSMFKPMSSEKIEHIDLAGWSNLFLLAPATANTVGKITSGIGDNLLTTTILALPEEIPLVIAPAMNDNMWKNIFVQENIKKIEKRKNCYIINPIKGSLASGKIGEGKMEEPKEIFEFIKKLLSK